MTEEQRAKLLEKKAEQDAIKKEYKDKEKVKKLTVEERLERIERLLKISE